MKPEAPDGIRGEFKPIDTAVPGVRVCEHLPAPGGAGRQAGGRPVDVAPRGEPPGRGPPRPDRPAVQPAGRERPRPRGLARRLPLLRRRARPARPPGRRHPQRRGAADPAGRGAAHLAGPGRRLPRPAGTTPGSSGSTRTSPRPATTAWRCPQGLDAGRLHRRRHLLGQAAVPPPGDAFVDQQDAALAMLCNGKVGRALDLDREDPRLVDRYGRHLFGRSLLMARRLVEAGVPVVQATMGIVQTWDTHVANFPRLKDDLLPAARPGGLGPARRPGGPRPARRDAGRDARRVRPDAPDHRADARATSRAATTGRRSSRRSSPAAGVVGGQVIGKSDRLGAYPISRTLRPARPRRDDLPRPGRRPRHRAPRPPRPPPAALLRRGDDPALHDRGGLSGHQRVPAISE